jgi:hypothetical protein
MWAWRAMVMMPTGEVSWLVHHSSLSVLPAKISGASRRNGRRSENLAYQLLRYVNGSFTCRKILRHGTSGFTSHPKEGVLRIFIAHKNPSSRPGLNPRLLGAVASTLTTAPPRRLCARLKIFSAAGSWLWLWNIGARQRHIHVVCRAGLRFIREVRFRMRTGNFWASGSCYVGPSVPRAGR